MLLARTTPCKHKITAHEPSQRPRRHINEHSASIIVASASPRMTSLGFSRSTTAQRILVTARAGSGSTAAGDRSWTKWR
uniref:Uncharacterized protein n=1 Tax=Arundo donax TaxID=35708 RepID=A0A0A9G7M7_ARUDO